MPLGRSRTSRRVNRRRSATTRDESHRSQCGFGGKVNASDGEMAYGRSSNMRHALPNASIMGFTGTPIGQSDAKTRAVFGEYVSG